MKILKIALQGINSIKDKHTIDLTHDAYTRQGIFAITGATGAGKTTILDAICLAIYGWTPRLDAITQNNNELMNKQSGECLAQVWLQINDKQYSFLFTQRRAKNSPTGKLQPAKREIYEVVAGEQILLENKITQVVSLVPKLLQMDFHQFTRSVMLAQGSFAAFLHSDINKRGELLEKITGTDIYAKISMEVYQTHKQKNQALLNHQQKINDVQLLTDDEHRFLTNTLNDTTHQYDQLNESLKILNDRLQKKQRYDDLMSDKIKLNQLLQNYENELIGFDDKLQRLKKATHVDIIKPIYDQQLNYNKELSDYNDELLKLSSNKEKLNEAYKQQKQITDNAYQLSQSADYDLQSMLPAIEKARLIDKDIEKQKTNVFINQDFLKQKKLQFDNHQNAIDDLHQIIKNHQLNQQSIINQSKQMSVIGDIATNHSLQQYIIEPYQIWQQHMTKWQDDFMGDGGIMSLHQQMMTHQDDIKTLIHTMHHQYKRIKNIQDLINQDNQTINEYKAQHNILSDMPSYMRTLEQTKMDYIDKLSELKQLKSEYENLCANKDEQSKKYEQIYQSQQLLDSLLIQKNHLQSSIEDANAQLIIAKNNYELAKDNDLLHHYFLQLKDNTPCPVCGSCEHPKKHNTDERAHNNLAVAKQQLSKQETMVHQLTLDYQKSVRDYDATHERIHLLNEQYQKQASTLNTFHETLTQKLIATTHQSDIDKIAEIYEHTQQQYNQINHDMMFLNELIKNTERLKADMDNLLSESYDNKLQLTNLINHYNHTINAINKNIQSINNHQQLNQSFLLLNNRLSDLSSVLRIDSSYFYQFNDKVNNHTYDSLNVIADMIKYTTTNDFDIDDIQYLFEKNYQIIEDIYHHQSSFDSASLMTAIKAMIDDTVQAFNRYFSLQDDLKTVNQKLDNALLQLDYENNTKNVLSDEMADLKKTINESTHQIHLLNAEKLQWIHTENTEQLFLQLNEKQQSTLKDYQNKNTQLEQIDRQLFDNTQRMAHIHKQTELLQNKASQNAHHLKNKLDEFGFLNIEECLSYQMTDDERAHIQTKHNSCLAMIDNTKGRLEQIHQSIEQITQTIADIAKTDSEALQQQISADTNSLNAHQERLFDIKNTLKQHDANAQNKAELLTHQQALAAEFDVWDKLNSAIGSADGKKYRNIVQAITLSRVLALANEALATMNNRYILTNTKTDDDKANTDSLEISVIDTHQANAIRAIKNLSGGETFLVSLALALGLSKIQSQQMSIDSLFLDEGFGTLDDEALDIALSALGELQQTGKMIGVISHIDSLKQRIGTHIEVSRISSGVSTIKGYGVSRC